MLKQSRLSFQWRRRYRMTLDDLKTSLIPKYKIDCWLSIEDLEQSASSTLYQFLKPWQKSAYDDNYRFVFLNFCSVQQQTLEHIISIITYLDISPYFLLVYSNQGSTIDFFKSHSINAINIDINYKQSSDKKIQPLFNTAKFMCAYAWAGLHVFPDGSVAPCCDYTGVVTDKEQRYNVKEHTIEQIVNSNHMKTLRQQFRNGQRPSGCQKCFHLHDQHSESRMSLAPYKLENVYGRIDWESDSSPLGFLGGHFGNLCNLKCRICSPTFSSHIATEILSTVGESVKDHPVYKIMINNRWSKKSNTFWHNLRQHVPHMCNFEFLGGEPLLLQENLDFLQFLIDSGHSKNTIIELITNGTLYPQIFDQINKFKKCTVTISVDNIGQRFELERSGCTWQQLNETVKKFVDSTRINPSLKIGVNITVSILNVLDLPETINWINQVGIDHYSVSMLEYPEYLSIKNVTLTAKKLILKKLCDTKLSLQDRQKINFIVNEIISASTSNGHQFCKYMKQKDILRMENFGETHAEIADAMGYNDCISI